MSVEERLVAAVTPVVAVCVPGVYTGDEPIHCTYNFTLRPDSYGDDVPETFIGSGMLHLFTPRTTDPRQLRRQLWQALFDADLGPGDIEDASDETGNHLVIAFEALGEV